MNPRKLFAVLLVLLVLLVGGGLWMISTEPAPPAPMDDTTAGAAVDVPGETAAGAKPRVEAAKRRGTPWTQKGDGALTGRLVEFGTDRPVAGVRVELYAGLPGPDRTVEAVSGEDGAFRFDAVPNFEQWQLTARPPAPLAETVLTDVRVVEDNENDVGTIYLTPGFKVPGLVVDEAGAPVEGARVRAVRGRTREERTDLLRLIRGISTEPLPVEAVETGEDGKFAFSKLSPNSYDLWVDKEGFQLVVEWDVIVTPDAWQREIRIVLPAGFALEGRVVRDDGGSVEGLTVIGFDQPGDDLGNLRLDRRFAVTDERGLFTLEGLGAGEYMVAVEVRGRPFALVGNVPVPSRTFLEIRIGGDAWLEGRVLGTGDKPVPGAEIYTFDGLGRDTPAVGRATADDQGRYRIEGLNSGPLQLILVQAEGYGAHPPNFLQVLVTGAGSGIHLSPGPNHYDVHLGRGATVRGVVIESDGEQPVAGVRLSLRSPRSFFGGMPVVTSDEEGRFEFHDVPLGTAVLAAEKAGWYQPGFTPQTFTMAAAREMGGSGAPDAGRGPIITVAEEGAVVERTVKLSPGSTLRGTVLAPGGEPVVGAQVSLRIESAGGFASELSDLFPEPAPRLTDSEGRFEIPGPPPLQAAHVRARAQGFLDGSSDELRLRPGESRDDLVVQMKQGAVVTGKVTDLAGKPIAGAQVRATPEDNEWSVNWRLRRADPALTGEDGSFRLANLPTGEMLVEASHPAHISAYGRSVRTEEGGSVNVDLQLGSAARITGKVVGPDGSPVLGASVDFRFLDPRPEGDGQLHRFPRDPVTGSDGSFTLEGLLPGRYRLIAEYEGAAPSPPVEASTSVAVPVTLRLSPAFVIAGSVRGPSGAGLGGIDVDVYEVKTEGNRTESRRIAGERTQADGTFVVRAVPAGRYELHVEQGFNMTGDGINVIKRVIQDVEAGTQGLLIELEAGLAIGGSIVGEDGERVATGYAWVNRVRPDDAPADWRGLNEGGGIVDGGFSIGGLLPGDYDLHVWIDGDSRGVARVTAGTTDVRVDMGAGAVVRGRVLDANGNTAPGVSVSVFPTGTPPSGFVGNATTNAEGEFVVKGVPAGSYRVTATVERDDRLVNSEPVEITVAERGAENVTLSLRQ